VAPQRTKKKKSQRESFHELLKERKFLRGMLAANMREPLFCVSIIIEDFSL
jgi:hypothetical protein